MNPLQYQEKVRNQILGSYNNVEKKSKFSKSETEALNIMLEKGEISDQLASGYGAGSQPFTFTKTGKQIKEQAPSIIASLEAQKVLLETQLNSLQQQAGIVPSESNSRRYDKSVSFLRYSYSVSEPQYVNGSYSDRTDQNDVCSKYNSLLWIYNDILDDIDAFKIIVENINESKQYNLSVSQLIALNFK